MVARRPVARLRDMDRRRRPHLEDACRRLRFAAATHARARLLSRSCVVARRSAHRSATCPARGAQHPHFGPEKDRVYVYSDAGLTSLRYDGTDRRAIVKVIGKSWFPQPPEKGEGNPADDVRLSPDGNWALAQVSTQLYLLAVPHMGGEAPTVDVNKAAVPLAKLTDVGADFLGWSA